MFNRVALTTISPRSYRIMLFSATCAVRDLDDCHRKTFVSCSGFLFGRLHLRGDE